MDTLDLDAPFNNLKTKLQASHPLLQVVEGVPEASSARLGAYLALGNVIINNRAAGHPVDAGVGGQYGSSVLTFNISYVAGFFYRVAYAEAAAERRIMDAVMEFIRQVYSDRTLGGTVHSSSLDMSLADNPDYLAMAGQEYRVYPVLVLCTQREVIPQI